MAALAGHCGDLEADAKILEDVAEAFSVPRAESASRRVVGHLHERGEPFHALREYHIDPTHSAAGDAFTVNLERGRSPSKSPRGVSKKIAPPRGPRWSTPKRLNPHLVVNRAKRERIAAT